ncbi:hypothetical protein FRA_35c07430 [Francisella sp. W12-1067]|nr:hypothetical protein FRA_35c07430 [Francisella sp. W12-1067]
MKDNYKKYPKKILFFNKLVSYLLLTTILAIFSFLELVVMILIFLIFMSFYVAIIILGAVYLAITSVFKIKKNIKDKKAT